MSKNAVVFLLCLLAAILLLDKFYCKRPVLVVTNIPKIGTVIGYEDFRGYKVPIKADGHGGTYKVVTDVPWSVFTIDEKFDMARVGGGYLSATDIQEIKTKYGKE